MKKISQLCLLFIISITSFGQFLGKAFPENKKNPKAHSLTQLRTAVTAQQRMDSIYSISNKILFTYDAQGNEILEVNYIRLPSSSKWVIYSKVEYSYDAKGNIIQHIDYESDEDYNLILDEKYDYTYDINNNQTREIQYGWDDINSMWINKYKTETTFNSKGLMTQSVNYNWNNSQWFNNGRTEFTYNSNDLLVTGTYYWPTGEAQSIDTYTYNLNGKVISKVTISYYGTETYNNRKEENTYDMNGNQTINERFNWNSQTNTWDFNFKTENVFDIQNNITQIQYSNWHYSTSEWVYESKSVYTYDLNYTVGNLVVPTELNDFGPNKLTGASSYFYEDGNWQSYEEYTLYYSDLTTTATIAPHSATQLLVYPNPTTGTVLFSNEAFTQATLQLFDVQGNAIYNELIQMNQPISLEGLNKGIYFYYVTDDSNVNYKGSLVIN